MTRNLVIFAACFLVGAIATTALRAALHKPYEDAPTVAAATTTAPAAMPAPAADPGAKPVNTLCPICGMKVNPALPTATWQGKVVGFGCKACPPKFQAAPDKYGPAALQNRVVEE